MRILICEGSLSFGGAERVVANLSNYLTNFETVKIVSTTKTESAYDIDKRISYECLDDKIYEKDKNFIARAFLKISKNFKRRNKLKKIICEYKPDIIMSFLPEPCFLTLSLKSKYDIPTIISVRNDPKIEYSSKLYNMLMRKLYPKADGIVFQTEDAMKYFEKILSCTKKIIPNSINPDFLVDNYSKKRNKNIVSVGRLQEQKNHELTIRAFSRIEKDFKDYDLLIYGDGNLREELQKLINSLDLQERVKLLGVTKDIKNKVYDAALYVLSSNYEGMPNSLMEAMTLGLPVIATDCPCGGPRFLINSNVNGVLIKVNDEDGLVSAMKQILEDKNFAEKLSKNAIKIQQTLSPSIINEKWYEFIKKVYTETKK